MLPKDYFRKTFVFVFIFFIVYKTVGMLMNNFSEFNLEYILKNLAAAFVTALVLGGINYYAKWDFFTKKSERSKDN